MFDAEFEKIYRDTESYIQSLEDSFLKKHLENQLATPDEYDYDVKSFCILCHAALEDFAETISLKVMSCSIDGYINNHMISEPLITLLHFKSSKGQNYIDKLKDNEPLKTNYDYIRETLNDVKSSFSNEIIKQNHGVSLKYLRQLLMPVAINIPNDLNLLNSLGLLANERGFYAHKFRDNGILKKSIEPEKAKNIVDDCLLLCWELRNQAKYIFKTPTI